MMTGFDELRSPCGRMLLDDFFFSYVHMTSLHESVKKAGSCRLAGERLLLTKHLGVSQRKMSEDGLTCGGDCFKPSHYIEC